MTSTTLVSSIWLGQCWPTTTKIFTWQTTAKKCWGSSLCRRRRKQRPSVCLWRAWSSWITSIQMLTMTSSSRLTRGFRGATKSSCMLLNTSMIILPFSKTIRRSPSSAQWMGTRLRASQNRWQSNLPVWDLRLSCSLGLSGLTKIRWILSLLTWIESMPMTGFGKILTLSLTRLMKMTTPHKTSLQISSKEKTRSRRLRRRPKWLKRGQPTKQTI